MRNHLVVIVLSTAFFAGCAGLRTAPIAPQTVGDLRPDIEDVDAGLVGMRPDFSPTAYAGIIVSPFKVSPSEIKDDEDARLAKDMIAYLQTQLVQRVGSAGIFTKVIDATATSELPADMKVLSLEGEMTTLTQGSQALRYWVGFGAGAAKAQIETRLVDFQSRRVELITADRREVSVGIFGGDSRQFVTVSLDQMAEAYAKLLRRLSAGGRPGPK
jgi:hypothetical protein